MTLLCENSQEITIFSVGTSIKKNFALWTSGGKYIFLCKFHIRFKFGKHPPRKKESLSNDLYVCRDLQQSNTNSMCVESCNTSSYWRCLLSQFYVTLHFDIIKSSKKKVVWKAQFATLQNKLRCFYYSKIYGILSHLVQLCFAL